MVPGARPARRSGGVTAIAPWCRAVARARSLSHRTPHGRQLPALPNGLVGADAALTAPLRSHRPAQVCSMMTRVEVFGGRCRPAKPRRERLEDVAARMDGRQGTDGRYLWRVLHKGDERLIINRPRRKRNSGHSRAFTSMPSRPAETRARIGHWIDYTTPTGRIRRLAAELRLRSAWDSGRRQDGRVI